MVIGASDATLDGFVVTGGHFVGGANHGAGMYLSGTSPRIANVTFRHNRAQNGSALAAVDGASPTITNTMFLENGGSGGAFYVTTGTPTLSNVVFRANTHYIGGAVYQSGSATTSISNAVFEDNTATCCGGALTVSGGTMTVTTALVRGNQASIEPGGGAFQISESATVTLKNVTLHDNVDTTNTPTQIMNRGALTMHNSIVWGGSTPVELSQAGTAAIRHSLVQGGTPTGVTDFAESSDSDPLFVEAPTNLRLLATSPGVDSGNSQLSELGTLDVAGLPRLVDGDGDDTADIDRGAYEYQP